MNPRRDNPSPNSGKSRVAIPPRLEPLMRLSLRASIITVRCAVMLAWLIFGPAICTADVKQTGADSEPVANATHRPVTSKADPELSNGPIRFQRVHVPANRIDRWPLGDGQYMPMDSDEFERLVKQVSASAETAAPRITEAEFRATLIDDCRLKGNASIRIDTPSHGSGLVSLGAAGMAVEGARWNSPERTTTLGVDRRGELCVLVDKPGLLTYDWSLAGRPGVDKSRRFNLELPPSTKTTLVLELPDNVIPTCDGGIGVADEPIAKGRTAWRYELGGRRKVVLRLALIDAPETANRQPDVRESFVYHFAEDGIEVKADLHIEEIGRSLRRITLSLDPRLELVSAQFGETPVNWSISSRAENERTEVVVELPQSHQATGRVLHLAALCPLVLDQPWRLPRVRPHGVFWRAGTATLVVPSPLAVEKIVPMDCRQSRLSPLPTSDKGEKAEFQFFSPDATVELTVARHRAAPVIDCSTRIEFGESEAAGEMTVLLRQPSGDLFELTARLDRLWIVDNVTSEVPGLVRDWRQHAPEGGYRRLAIRLGWPPGTKRGDAKLTITGRRLQSSLGQVLRADDLVMATFPEAEGGRRLFTVGAQPPYELDVRGDGRLRRLAQPPLGKPANESSSKASGSLTFVRDAGADELRVKLVEPRPGHACNIHATANVSDAGMLESYRFRCAPQSSRRMDHVLIHFSLAREAPLRWSLGEAGNQPLAAERLTSLEQAAAGVGPSGETWKVPLVPARSEPFVIRASRMIGPAATAEISLAAMPKATTQSATLVVRAQQATPLRIVNRRLERIPTEPPPPGEYQTARATFRYRPEQLSRWSTGKPIVIHLDTQANNAARAFAWDCQIDSRFECQGGVQHLATWFLENAGQPHLRVRLPSSPRKQQVQEVWVDGRSATWRMEAGRSGGQVLVVDLPPRRRFPVVTVELREDAPALGFVDTIQSPALEADVPVQDTRWTAWIPPSHRSLDASTSRESSSTAPSLWRERLFGPLARGVEPPPFNPLAIDDWAKLVPLDSGESAAHVARQFLTILGKPKSVGQPKGQEAERTLGGLLDRAAIRQSGLTLLVDRLALARAGAGPATTLRPSSDTSSDARGASMLRQTGLVLLIHGRIGLLTTSRGASRLQAHLEPLRNSSVWQVLPGPLALDVEEAAGSACHERWMPAGDWAQQLRLAGTPWSLSARPATIDMPGWSAHCQKVTSSQSARLAVIHRHGIRMLRLVAFLMAAGLGMWTLRNRPRRLLLVAAACALAALLLPVLPATVASGTLLGTLFCLAARALRRPAQRTQEGHSASLSGTTFERHGLLAPTESLRMSLLIACLLGCCAASFGEEPAAQSAPDQVLIPIDKQRKPSGSEVYVPRSLYDRLHRRAASDQGGVRGWLIERATYRSELTWEGLPKRLVPGPIRASYRIRVFDAPGRIQLPFSRSRVTLPDQWAFLDGHRIQPTWAADGSGLSFAVPAEGYYLLEIVFNPVMRVPGTASREPASQNHQGFDVPIPCVPQSRFELSLPANAPKISLPTAQGRVVVNDQRLSARLGGANRLQLRWNAEANGPTTDTTVEADQLLWLNITPGAVVLDAQFHVRVLQGRIGELRLSADPRLKLLGKPSLGRLENVPGSPGTMCVKLPAPRAENFTLSARFTLQDTPGVGHHRLPRLTVANARVVQRRFAVSIDDSLRWTESLQEPNDAAQPGSEAGQPIEPSGSEGNQAVAPLRHVAVSDLLATWGDSESTARLAYEYRDDVPPWSIATRPSEPRTVVDQQLTASFSPRRADLRYEAQIDTSAGYGFRYRLHVPQDLNVESLAVFEKDVDRLARWSRADDGSIDVVLSGPARTRRRLELRGHVVVPKSGLVDLPMPRIEDAYLQFFHVTVLRQSPVLLELDQYAGFEEAELEVIAPGQSPGSRPFASLINSGRKPPRVRVRVLPNHPKTDVRQTLTMQPVAGKWQARLQFDVTPRAGIVDEIRLAMPPGLADHCEIDPPSLTATRVSGDDRDELVLRAARPLVDDMQFAVTIPLGSEPVSAPDITVRGANTQQRHLVLPRRTNNRALSWDTRRLERVSATPRAITYKIAGNDFRARLMPPGGTDGATRVYLADVNLAWRQDGACHGVVHFDLEGSARHWCPLTIPEQLQAIQIVVDGVPTTAEPVTSPDNEAENGDHAQFRIPLGSRRLPQRISVVFAGRLPGGHRSERTFQTPRLGNVPVDRSIWTLAGPRRFEAADQTDTLRPLFNTMRADSLARMIELAAKSDADTIDKLRWARIRQSRLLELQVALDEQLRRAPASQPMQPTEETLRTLREQWTALSDRLPDLPLLDPGQTPAHPSCEAVQGIVTFRESGSTIHRAATGGLGPLTLHYRRDRASWATKHLLPTALLGLVFALVYVAAVRGWWQAVYRRWPAGLVVGVGLLWWWLLTPSILGMVIAAAGIWLTFRPNGHKPHHADSRVLTVD